jgi:glutathione S-transferase
VRAGRDVITLYYSPRTRSVRIRWLLEELGAPYELRRVDFKPPTGGFFSQATPGGKFPVIEDGDVVVSESGAIAQYLCERFDDGRLAPPVGSPLRPRWLQWMHFAEATAFPPIGTIVWHRLYKGDADSLPTVIDDARQRARTTLAVVEDAVRDQDFLLGAEFSAADVMMGFTLIAAQVVGVLDETMPNLAAYLGRLTSRPAFVRATAD